MTRDFSGNVPGSVTLPVALRRFPDRLVDDDLLARPDHVPAEPERVERLGRQCHADTTLDHIREAQDVGDRVVDADREIVDREHLAELGTDPIDDRLEIELGRHALLDGVDQRELGIQAPAALRGMRAPSASSAAWPRASRAASPPAACGCALCCRTGHAARVDSQSVTGR
jgi:hypothetical protein